MDAELGVDDRAPFDAAAIPVPHAARPRRVVYALAHLPRRREELGVAVGRDPRTGDDLPPGGHELPHRGRIEADRSSQAHRVHDRAAVVDVGEVVGADDGWLERVGRRGEDAAGALWPQLAHRRSDCRERVQIRPANLETRRGQGLEMELHVRSIHGVRLRLHERAADARRHR